jgi:Protein of unknown function (DUF3631)
VSGSDLGAAEAEFRLPLKATRRFIRRYVVLPAEAADFLALWVAHTHAFEAAVTTPYVRVVSAERASGKTRLLEVLSLLVRRGWLNANPSAATIFRKGDADAPTLLLDEVDQVPFRDRMDLLSVLNSGYRIGVKVPRCNDKGELFEFDVFYPKAFAGIDDGKLPDTLVSRSIPVRLERRRQDESIERFRHRIVEPAAEELRDRIETWAIAHLDALADAEPGLPDELGDREQEVWEPLLSIADLAGGDWPQRARDAAVQLARAKGRTGQDESRGIKLLEDLRRVFRDKGDPERLFSADLVEALNAIEEAAWGGWNDGSGIRTRDLARELVRYPITTQKIRIGEHTRQGFYRRQFVDAWARYLPALSERGGENRTNPGLEPDVLFPPTLSESEDTFDDQEGS